MATTPLPSPRTPGLGGSSQNRVTANPLRPKPDPAGTGSSADLPDGGSRPLTGGEIGILQKYFKSSINYASVKIHNGKYMLLQPGNTAMTPAGEAYFPGAIYRDDYSEESVGGRAFFVHEMTHVWQMQNNVVQDLRVLGLKNVFNYGNPHILYDYTYHYKESGILDLTDYGFEQQAAIIQDYYRMINMQHCNNCASAMTLEDYDSESYGLLREFLKNPSYANGRNGSGDRRP